MEKARRIRHDGIKLRTTDTELRLLMARRRAELARTDAEIAHNVAELEAWNYGKQKMMQEADRRGYQISVRKQTNTYRIGRQADRQ